MGGKPPCSSALSLSLLIGERSFVSAAMLQILSLQILKLESMSAMSVGIFGWLERPPISFSGVVMKISNSFPRNHFNGRN